MGRHSPVRVLLVEDDAADRRFLQEALQEAASSAAWPGPDGVEVMSVDALDAACDIAFDGGFDVILLNLSLPDSPAPYETFSQLTSVAHATPILVLADENDPVLAGHLLREGAQDVMLKKNVDAAPLAISIRYALERQRFVNTLRFMAAPPLSPPAVLPPVTTGQECSDDVLLLSLVRVDAVTAQGVDAEAVMLSD